MTLPKHTNTKISKSYVEIVPHESVKKVTLINQAGELVDFTTDDEGNLKVVIKDQVIGSFTPSGLGIDHKNTILEVSTTAIALPTTPLDGRNSLSIRNLSTTETLYIGKADVVASENVGNTAGWQVGPNESYNVDVNEDIIVYGIVSSGTIKVQTRELA